MKQKKSILESENMIMTSIQSEKRNLNMTESVELASSSKKIILPQKISPSKFNKKQKERKDDDFANLDDIFSKIELIEEKKREKKLIKNYNWNGMTALKINDEILGFQFMLKNLENKNYEIFKTKGITVINGLLENENQFDIQNFEIKFEENEGNLLLQP